MVKEYIAYGGGVGSTKILLGNVNLIKKDLEVIYSNHQSDLPETFKYIDYIKNELDIDITVLNVGNLYDYCWKHKILPSIYWRWCTDKFKVRPMKRYVDGDIPLIGLTYDERSRSKGFRYSGKSEFPLINNRITRNKALKSFNCDIPYKSGCFFCPFQSKEEWRQLYLNHHDLFLKALKLEEKAKQRNQKIYLYKGGLKRLYDEFRFQSSLITI